MVMMTIKEAANYTNMSVYAIRRGVNSGIYPSIRVGDNPRGKILINVNLFLETLNKIAQKNMATVNPSNITNCVGIRRVAE